MREKGVFCLAYISTDLSHAVPENYLGRHLFQVTWYLSLDTYILMVFVFNGAQIKSDVDYKF